MSRLKLVPAAFRLWDRRRWLVAIGTAVGTAVLLGLATVLIPNPVFRRDIAPLAWNYPVWIITAVLSGLLFATYVKDRGAPAEVSGEKSALGLTGAFLAWFAVGCPVCNKIALIALGYTGALTYFAPWQPVLAVVAILALSVALVYRLAGMVACPVPPAKTA